MLKGKIALVTGSSRGIGRAVALRLARGGAFTYVNYARNETAAGETLSLIHAEQGEGALCPFNVEDADAVREAVGRIVKEKSRIDILVNNAGIWMGGLALRIQETTWDRVMAVNLKGAFNCCQAVMRPMMKQRWGRIINMSSVIAEAGNAGDVVYGTAKAGILGLTKSLARELAARNICVNAVSPGFIETDMTARIPPDMKSEMHRMIPLERLGRPEDVAGAVAFLASDEAGYMTGQVLHVNGGLYM